MAKPTGYIVRVSDKKDHAALLCVIYSLDRQGKILAGDFAEIGSSFSSQEFKISPGRAFTFQEELRVLARVTDLLPSNTEDVNAWIDNKMKEGYGSQIQVSIEKIELENAG